MVVIECSAQRYAGSGVQESTPTGVTVFHQEQEQEWIFFLATGAGVIF